MPTLIRSKLSPFKWIQLDCAPSPPLKLTHGARNGIVIGTVAFTLVVLGVITWIVPLKALQVLRRPLDLFELYGWLGFVLLLFGSRTTWRTEAYVLGKVNDSDALEFKKYVQDECTMISVAVCLFFITIKTSYQYSNPSSRQQ